MICPKCKHYVFEADVFSQIPNGVHCQCGEYYSGEQTIENTLVNVSLLPKETQDTKTTNLNIGDIVIICDDKDLRFMECGMIRNIEIEQPYNQLWISVEGKNFIADFHESELQKISICK